MKKAWESARGWGPRPALETQRALTLRPLIPTGCPLLNTRWEAASQTSYVRISEAGAQELTGLNRGPSSDFEAQSHFGAAA